MKTLRLLFACAAACTAFIACSDDDSDNNTNETDNIAGRYTLITVIAPEMVDFDGNGVVSANLMDESVCYLNSHITLKDDHTYEAEYNHVLLESETGCTTETATGTWEKASNLIILTNTSVGPEHLITNVNYSPGLLTNVLNNAPYPTVDEEGNEVYAQGTITLSYERVEE